MKRILCLLDSLGSGGAQRQMVGLASMLKSEGYKIKVITYFDIPFYLPLLRDNSVEYEYLPCSNGLLYRLIAIQKAINQFKPEVVISYLDTPNILICLLHVFHPQWKLIVSERNTTQKLTLKNRIKFALYRFTDIIVPNAYSQGDFIINHFPKYAYKCHVITNFVDIEKFYPINNINIKQELHIIGVGRISRQKNIPLLINATHNIIKKGYKIRVDWYGKKYESYDYCMKLVEKYDLNDTFTFHPTCSDIMQKYIESSLFVLPSLYEGFPNVLCEAMACGLPVIASDVCDNIRIVRDGENGYIFKSNNIKHLTDCILRFINLPGSQRKTMGENSRKIAVELFSKEKFLQKYIKLIEQ